MANNTLQIEILDDIGGWYGYTFKDLYQAARGFKGDSIRVVINSFGGSVLEGLLIFNYLKGHKARVETHIPGYAMSMGTVIAAAGDYVTMADTGYFMIHNPWGVEMGDHENMADMSQLLLQMTNDLADIYVARTGLDKQEILDMMKAETWLTPQEALEMGFVDELTVGAKFEASLDPKILAQFENVPEALRPPQPDNPMNKPETILDKIKDLLGMNAEPADAAPAEPAIADATAEDLADLRNQVNTHLQMLDTVTERLVAAEAANAAHDDIIAALLARIDELESQPAGGTSTVRADGDPPAPDKPRSYQQNPIYLQARKIAQGQA